MTLRLSDQMNMEVLQASHASLICKSEWIRNAISIVLSQTSCNRRRRDSKMINLQLSKAEYLEYIRNVLEEELCMSAPNHWSDEQLSELETEQITEVQAEIDGMSPADIGNVSTMTSHAHRAALALIQRIQYRVREEVPW